MSITASGDTYVVRPHRLEDLCVVPPSPELREKRKEAFEQLRSSAGAFAATLRAPEPTAVGLNDGLIYPGDYYPIGTTARVAQRAALERAPLRGTVRVVVVLVDFSDKAMAKGAQARFQELFFSTGVLANGSVKEYFTEVSRGLITLDGQVVGPFRMPQKRSVYAGSNNGTQPAQPNARTMADDAVSAANATVNFAPYDNDGNGYVDAFIVVHAGRGAEETGAATDIWSHKWVLPAERTVDSTKIFAYLTIPEDAKIGVCAHELGHLLFGWPDLYDTDGTSEGIGNWCLMAGGSWGLGGDRPVHPSAWCKATQGWVDVVVQTTNATVPVTDVKQSHRVYRLWKDGSGGSEYFLLENRQQADYDQSLPAGGLLIWHIDDAVATNTNEAHYKVALMQADGGRDMENNLNRGDAGDPYPGSAGNVAFTTSSNPSSKSYAGVDTCVSVTDVPASAPTMSVRLGVRCFVKPPKHSFKDGFKDHKEAFSDELKPLIDSRKLLKDIWEGRGKGFGAKELTPKELRERPLDWRFDPRILGGGRGDLIGADVADLGGAGGGTRAGSSGRAGGDDAVAALTDRVQALEMLLQELLGPASGAPPEPFISSGERPDLGDAAYVEDLRARMLAGDPEAIAAFNALPPQ